MLFYLRLLIDIDIELGITYSMHDVICCVSLWNEP